MEILKTFNAREAASILWFFVIIIFALKNPTSRTAVYNLFKAFFVRKILIVIVLMLSYIAVLLISLKHFYLWDTSLLKEALYWTFGSAFVFLLNAPNSSEKNYFKKVLLGNVKFLVLLEFLINFYTFNFFVELLLIPFLVFIFGIEALAANKEGFSSLKKFLNGIQVILGIIIILFTLSEVTTDYMHLITIHNIRALMLAPTLTILFIPFLYVFMFYALYENLFVRINVLLKNNHDLQKYLKIKIILLNHLNFIKLRAFSDYSGGLLLKLNDREDVNKMISDFKRI